MNTWFKNAPFVPPGFPTWFKAAPFADSGRGIYQINGECDFAFSENSTLTGIANLSTTTGVEFVALLSNESLSGNVTMTFSAEGDIESWICSPMRTWFKGAPVIAGCFNTWFSDAPFVNNGTAVDNFSGVAALTFTGAGTLSWTQNVDGLSAMVFGDQSTLTAFGRLIGQADLVFDLRGTLTNATPIITTLIYNRCSPERMGIRRLNIPVDPWKYRRVSPRNQRVYHIG